MAPRQKKSSASRDVESSPVAQNYLLALYMMQEEKGQMTMTRLAEELATSPATEHLGTSLASVAGMIRRMKRDGLIDIMPSKEIVFTNKGQSEARAMMRRHQLAERLLVDTLGVPLHLVHAEAHRLEHAISPEVEDRMNRYLGSPLRCPFGHPIPGNGYEPPESAMHLGKAPPGKPMTIERIPEDDPKLVEYLVKNDLLPGVEFTVTEVALYRGTITMDVAGKEVVVGILVAPRILVGPTDAAVASTAQANSR